MGYIYKITNIKNNKCYIGETVQDIKKRWRDHLSAIKRDGGCKALKSAITKYGLESFKFEIIIICFDDDRLIYEKQYIKKYNSIVPNGYNILAGGQEGVLGFKHSEETKRLISLKSKENSNKPEMKNILRQNGFELNKRINSGEVIKKSEKWYKALEEGRIGNRGGKSTDETKKKISEGLKSYYSSNHENKIINKEKWYQMLKNKKGVNLNEEHKNNISSGLSNYFNSKYEVFYNNSNDNIQDSRTKYVGEYDMVDTLIKIYPSIAEASRKIGITAHHMGKIIRRKNNKYNNSIWKYYDEKNLKTNEESIFVEK